MAGLLFAAALAAVEAAGASATAASIVEGLTVSAELEASGVEALTTTEILQGAASTAYQTGETWTLAGAAGRVGLGAVGTAGSIAAGAVGGNTTNGKRSAPSGDFDGPATKRVRVQSDVGTQRAQPTTRFSQYSWGGSNVVCEEIYYQVRASPNTA